MKTVGYLKQSVAGLVTGTSLDDVTQLDTLIERTTRTVGIKTDVPEAIVKFPIQLYDGVFDYLAPTTIFGSAVVDLRRQGVSSTTLDQVSKQPIALFNQTKAYLPSGYNITFEYDKGIPIMRVATRNVFPRAILDPMTSTTGWVASGTASDIGVDQTSFYNSPASLRFNISGAGTATLTKTLSPSSSLADYENIAVGFLAISIPGSVANLTSISVKVGSSASDYDSVSETEGFLGAWVEGEWLLVAFDFSQASSTGTPDWAAIDYLQVNVATTGGYTAFHVGGFWLSLPVPHTLFYETTAVFKVGNTISASITSDSDFILYNDAAFAILEYETALEVILQNSGSTTNGLGATYTAKLHGSGNDIGLYAQYRADNPSQELRTIGSYYELDY